MIKYIQVISIILLIVSCGGGSESSKPESESLKAGKVLYEKYGCIVCHSLEGKDIYGPPLNNIYMKEVQVIRDGEELTFVADREYLKRAISDPRSEKVKAYNNKDMPETHFSEKDVDILVDFIIKLNENSEK